MEKKVTRKEVNIFVQENNTNNNRPPSSSSIVTASTISSKFANQGKNLIVGNSTYQLPDPNSLAQKYGIDSDLQKEQETKEKLNHLENELSSKQQQIAEFSSIISSLKSKMEEKNKKIEHLCILIESIEPIPGLNPSKIQDYISSNKAAAAPNDDNIDLRDSKIVSLAKKSHNLTMLLNKEKLSNTQLSNEIEEWKRKYEMLVHELENIKSSMEKKNNEAKIYHRSMLGKDGSIRESVGKSSSDFNNNNPDNGGDSSATNSQQLQKQLKESLKLVDDLKKKNSILNDENNSLKSTLKKELGEGGVTLEQAVDSGWRGRAQQIVMLKSKIKQLESTIANGTAAGGSTTLGIGTSRRNNATFNVDSRAEEGIIEMSKERRQIVEALTEERVQLMEDNQMLEKKSAGQKARIQNLETEVKKMKDSVQVALEKSNTDDQLIDALKAEITRLQQRLQKSHEETLKGKKAFGKGGTTLNGGDTMMSSFDDSSMMKSQEWTLKEQQYKGEVTRLQRQIRNQNEQLESQDITIRDLRKQLKPY